MNKATLVVVSVLFSAGLFAYAATSTFTVGLSILAEDVTATIQWLVPEARVGGAETNDDVSFYLRVASSNDSDGVIYFTQATTATTSVDGTYLTPISLTGVVAGTYDIIVKTHQHLSAKLDNVTLASGNNTFNFTQADNSVSKGSLTLRAGDISGTWSSDPSDLGDNVVNSIDLSLLLNDLDNTDSTGNEIRANLNQDTAVNSVDLSLMLSHLDEEGDE